MTAATLAVMMLLADSQPATPPPGTPPPPRGMSHARLYLGPSTGQQNGSTGSGGVIGYQSFNEISPSASSFWGIEVLGWQLGGGVFPIFTGDLGLRWAPFPYAFLRPYLTFNVGLSFLVILPIPSLAIGLGVALPLGDAFILDAGLRARYALNYFDTAHSVQIASFEIGIGF